MDGEPASRIPLSADLQTRAKRIAYWVSVVGIAQAIGSGIAILFLGIGMLALLSHGIALAMVVAGLMLAFWVLYFRQALLLQSAADHFADIANEPEDAHDHLVIALQRMRKVFFLDVVAASILALGNLADWLK